MDKKKILEIAIKATQAWRDWHRPNHGSFPSDEVIRYMGELDELVPGVKISEQDDSPDPKLLKDENSEQQYRRPIIV